MSIDALVSLLQTRTGQLLHTGPWLTVDQKRIDDFAAVTGDIQWIHTDPARAAVESPYRTTVAHGYLTLSLLPFLTESNHPDFFSRNYPGMRYRINYGLNRVRFPAPVRCGDRIRALTVLESYSVLPECVQILYLITVEIEGGARPACVAESVVRVYP